MVPLFSLRRLAAAIAIAVLVAMPRSAAADDSHPYGRTPLSQKEKLRWNVMMREGRTLVEGERWLEATAKFTEAIKLDPHPEAYLWKGFAEEKLGHLTKAKAMYSEARDQAKADNLVQFMGSSEEALAEIGKKIPSIVVHLPAGVRATVSIDGAPVAVSSEGIDVNPGSRSLDVSAPGRESFHIKVKAEEGHVYRFDVALPMLPPESPAPPVEGPRGCGACAVGNVDGPVLPSSFAALAVLLLSKRRRSGRRRA